MQGTWAVLPIQPSSPAVRGPCTAAIHISKTHRLHAIRDEKRPSRLSEKYSGSVIILSLFRNLTAFSLGRGSDVLTSAESASPMSIKQDNHALHRESSMLLLRLQTQMTPPETAHWLRQPPNSGGATHTHTHTHNANASVLAGAGAGMLSSCLGWAVLKRSVNPATTHHPLEWVM